MTVKRPRQGPLLAPLRQGARDTEVGDERVSLAQQDVVGLDVAMDHALVVRVVERCDSRSSRARSDSPATNGMVNQS